MRLRFATLLTASVFAGAVALAACSNEGEGEPCDQNNYNNDCNDGLICRTPPNPNTANAPAICCPPDLSQATTPECSLPSGGIGDASTLPPDGSAPDARTTMDARAEAAPDASAPDGASDASADGSSSEGAADSSTDATDGAADGAGGADGGHD